MIEVKHFRNQEAWISNDELLDKWILNFLDITIEDNLESGENYQNMANIAFWKRFFKKLLENDALINTPIDVHSQDLVDKDSRIIKVNKSIFVKQYKDKVYKLMDEYKHNKDDDKQMYQLQKNIEDLTMNFSEKNIYGSCPNILKMMTQTHLPNGKEYLHLKYKVDNDRIKILQNKDIESNANEHKKNVRSLLTDDEKMLLVEFGPHTVECLLIHTISCLFNISLNVSVASLIDRIDSCIRQHGNILNKNILNGNKVKAIDKAIDNVDIKKQSNNINYPFGTALLEFLIERNIITITTKNLDDIKSCETYDGKPIKFNNIIKKKGLSFYRDKSNFAECTFNTALLPVKLNLPMVYKPIDWTIQPVCGQKTNLTLSDITGGYLIKPSSQMYNSYRLLSTPNIDNFNIFFGEINDRESQERAKKVCTSISWLQSQAFQINSKFLRFLMVNMDLMVSDGYLLPEFLSNITLNEASKLLRECYMESCNHIRNKYKLSQLVEILSKKVQESCYEQTIIDMANAYDGYKFYYPAFLDFRGRIYRSGIFHFHERDFARSLILLAEDGRSSYNEEKSKDYLNRYLTATAYHHSSINNEKCPSSVIVDIYEKLIYNYDYF